MSTESEPIEDLYFDTPDCPRCLSNVDGDGDGWWCDSCNLEWDRNGQRGTVQRV